jgi:hypothetical protein
MKSGDINLRFDEFKLISDEIMNSEIVRSKDNIIRGKEEVIMVLQQNIESKEKDIAQLREVIGATTKQNEIITKQNAWLTNLITAPRNSRSPARSNNNGHEARGDDAETQEHVEVDPEHDHEDYKPEDEKHVDPETSHIHTSDVRSSPVDHTQSTQETPSAADPQS